MSDERPDALLKSALEKIVYFEARAEQLHREVSASRAELERLKRELAEAGQREIGVRRELAELEVRLGRSLAERDELNRVQAALRLERTQLMGKLLEASRIHGAGRPMDDEADFGVDLASFISQLRSEALAPPSAEPSQQSAVFAAMSLPAPQAPQLLAHIPTLPPTVTQEAQRFSQEGRLKVSQEDLASLSGPIVFSGHAEETLLGFSLRELSATDPAARVRAAARLKSLNQAAAAPALAAALHAEDDPQVQVSLLQAFSEVCKEEGASVVAPLLGSPSPEVRIAALKALLHLAPRDAAPHLAQAMKDPDRSVRRRASLLALGLEGESARRLGEEAIHDEDPEVRSLAALALGAGSGEQARGLLLEALKDPELRVRRAAAQSLSRILGQDVAAVAQLDEGPRRREIRRLATLPVQLVRATWSAASKLPAKLPEPPPPMTGHQRAPPPVGPRMALPMAAEALCAPLMTEIRGAIRGRSLGELTQGLATSPENAQEALTLLVARGAVVRRGHKYFVA